MKQSTMPREIYRREDIRNVILAILSTNEAVTAHVPIDEIRIYNAGFVAATRSFARAFDVDIDNMEVTIHPSSS